MLDLFGILLPTLAALFHERHDLVVENLLLRHPASPVPVKSRGVVDIGAVYRRERLGGLIHEYEIAA
jgi:hypothetical protein